LETGGVVWGAASLGRKFTGALRSEFHAHFCIGHAPALGVNDLDGHIGQVAAIGPNFRAIHGEF
jgi:hypothetical protein